MKNLATFRLLSLLCLIGLSTLLGCGDTEDTEERMEATGLLTEPLTEDVRETDDVDAEPLEVPIDLGDVPHDWYKTKDPKLHGDYFHSILINQFGDIPEVHIVAAFHRKRLQGIPVTFEERIAYLEAQTGLWPTPRNKETLKTYKNLQEMEETEDPEVFATLFREYLVDRFGDIREVDILVAVEKKWKAGGAVADDEYLAYLEARFRLFPNKFTLRELQEALAAQG